MMDSENPQRLIKSPTFMSSIRPLLDHLRADLVGRYGEIYLPLIDSAVTSMAPLMLKEGHSYSETLNSLAAYLKNSLPLQRNANSALQDMVDPSQDKPETSSKRTPPLRPKEKVVDEWAAVMLQQAEIERKVEEEKKRLYREQQRKYKEELDKQHAEAMDNKARGKILDGVGYILSKDPNERQKMLRRKATKEELIREMEEHRKTYVSEKTRAQLERQMYDEYVKQQEEADERKKLEDAFKKQQVAAHLRGSYDAQAQARKDRLLTERELDKKIIEQQNVNWPFIDYERQRRYESIRRGEEHTKVKTILYENMVKEKALREQRAREEFLEKMRIEKERKDRENETLEMERKLKEREITRLILSHQLQEKAEQKKQKERVESEFFRGVQNKLSDMERQEKDRLEKEAMKKVMYKEYLRKQMEEDERRKKMAPTQMSEHERRLNNRDIEAYMNKMTTINSKVVGLRSNPIGPHQKYIAQKYGFKSQEYSPVSGNRSSALEIGAYMTLDDPTKMIGANKRMSVPDSKGEVKVN